MRSLADDLRARDDAELAALLLQRPDLTHPVPADLGALAQRAASPGSVARALADLDQFDLAVTLAAALADAPIRPSALVAVVAPHLSGSVATARSRVRQATGRLRQRALMWGSEHSLHLVGPARDQLVPADRGPRLAVLDPVVAGYAGQPETLHALLQQAPDGARAALDRLLAGPLVGTVADARRRPDPDRGGVDWLLAHHLVVAMGPGHVVVPAEVAAILRDQAEAPAPPPRLEPPVPARPDPAPERADGAGAGAVLDVLHAVAELGRTWSSNPPAPLRTGGVGTRDLARTARATGVPQSFQGLLIEVAGAAGLVAVDDRAGIVGPTADFDAWTALAPPQQHAALALAWLRMPRRVAADARPLAPDLADDTAPGLRRDVLAALAGAAGGWTDQEVADAVVWRAPRRPARGARVAEILAQLRLLGLLVAGTLTAAGRALLEEDESALAHALASSLPPTVDRVVVQADLTAIVPGLPTRELDELLRLAADAESRGAASVYRFSAESIRRALDTGLTAGDLLAALRRHADLPQPVAFLVEDIGRRHAVLRLGTAATYLRCDDPVTLAALRADPAAASLGLVALSDTVMISDRPAEHVLAHLTGMGLAPLPEPGRGPAPGHLRRARPPARQPTTPALTPMIAAAAVRAMRAAGVARPARRPGPADGSAPPEPADSPAEVVRALSAAIAADRAVRLGYAEQTGVHVQRHVAPLRLAGGYLTALDLATDTIRTYALARVSAVTEA